MLVTEIGNQTCKRSVRLSVRGHTLHKVDFNLEVACKFWQLILQFVIFFTRGNQY